MSSLIRSDNVIWTNHSLQKLRQYSLSSSRIMRILRHPKRREVGIAPQTVASMQPAGTKKHPYEIWAMHVQGRKTGRLKIISAWRYPGVSPVHEPPPIPDEVWEILQKER